MKISVAKREYLVEIEVRKFTPSKLNRNPGTVSRMCANMKPQ